MTAPNNAKRTIGRGLIVIAVVLALGLTAGGMLVLGGFLPLSDGTAHPPCNQLPSASQAQAALAANPDLAAQLTDQGPGVAVRVDSPGCNNEDQSLIDVTYSTDEERGRIDDVLTQSDGFGVPVYLHRN